MPGALRGEEGRALYGLPNPSEKDALKVKIAHELLQHVSYCCLYAHRRHVPFYIENPLTSRLWKMPEIRQLLQLPRVLELLFDYCQYGEAWRKSTKLFVSRHADLRVIENSSRFQRGYKCSATRKRHHVLSGTDGKTC